jgi:hypothetical protein
MNFSDLLKTGSSLNPKATGRFICWFWNKYRKGCFALFSFMVILLGAYLWYHDLYQSDWSSEKIRQFNSSQNKEIEFKEKEFQRVLSEIERRKGIYDKTSDSVKDIFKPYTGEETEERLPGNSSSVPASVPANSGNSGSRGTF